MYQIARMLDTTHSRTALLVCITRLAMRPAKSFWKKGQLCRTTCQWLCHRMRLVAPGTTALFAHQAVAQQRERPADEYQQGHADEAGQGILEGRQAMVRLHQPDESTDEDRDGGVDQCHRQPGHEHRGRRGCGSVARSANRTPRGPAAARSAARGWAGYGSRRN